MTPQNLSNKVYEDVDRFIDKIFKEKVDLKNLGIRTARFEDLIR